MTLFYHLKNKSENTNWLFPEKSKLNTFYMVLVFCLSFEKCRYLLFVAKEEGCQCTWPLPRCRNVVALLCQRELDWIEWTSTQRRPRLGTQSSLGSWELRHDDRVLNLWIPSRPPRCMLVSPSFARLVKTHQHSPQFGYRSAILWWFLCPRVSAGVGRGCRCP